MDWRKLENIIGESLPLCVQKILSVCGYDTFTSIQNITLQDIFEMQQFINDHFRETTKNFTCCHADFYKNQNKFKFLPGHKALIVALPKLIENQEQRCKLCMKKTKLNDYSFLMNELIETVNNNSEIIDKRNVRYSDDLRYLATYIFLSCGRSCYEFLNRNLPLPSTKTICKLKSI